MVPVADEKRRAAVEAIMDLVKSEISVKDLKIVGNDEGILVKSVKPDFKNSARNSAKNMKAAAGSSRTSTPNRSLLSNATDICHSTSTAHQPGVELSDVEIISEDIPGWLVAKRGSLTIALDVTVTPELRREGIARDIVNRIQNIRKARNYDITDRIRLVFAPGADTDDAIRDFADYISRQVLATSLEIVPLADSAEGVRNSRWTT